MDKRLIVPLTMSLNQTLTTIKHNVISLLEHAHKLHSHWLMNTIICIHPIILSMSPFSSNWTLFWLNLVLNNNHNCSTSCIACFQLVQNAVSKQLWSLFGQLHKYTSHKQICSTIHHYIIPYVNTFMTFLSNNEPIKAQNYGFVDIIRTSFSLSLSS